MGLLRPRPAPPLQSVDPDQIARRHIPQQSHKLLFRTTPPPHPARANPRPIPGAQPLTVYAPMVALSRATPSEKTMRFSHGTHAYPAPSRSATAIWKPSWRSSTCSTQTTSATPPARACSSTLTAPYNLASATHAKCKSACATFFDRSERE